MAKRKRPTLPEIGEAAQVTPEDLERAKAAWRKDAPAEYRFLLDAVPVPDPEDAE